MSETSEDILLRLTEPLKANVIGQYQSKRLEYIPRQKRDQSAVLQETMMMLEQRWADLPSRLRIVPGKEVFAMFNKYLQDKYGFSLTTRQVTDVIRQNEIPEELRITLRELDRFRRKSPDDAA